MKTVLIFSLVVVLLIVSVINLVYTIGFRKEVLSSIDSIGTENLEIELKRLSTEIEKVKDTVESLDIVDYSPQILSFKEDFTSLETAIDNLNLRNSQDYSTLKESLDSLEESVNKLQSLVGENKEVPENQHKIEELAGKIELMESEFLKNVESIKVEVLSRLDSIRLPEISTVPTYDATEGRGIRIRIESGFKGSSILHDSDLLVVMNELYSLKATSISLNGKRILPYTYIRCVGSTVIIDGEPTTISPIVIEVLGDYDYLVSGLGLLSEAFKGREIDMTFLPLEFITIPAGGG
jgi:uncharacterized protein YlxW (UPF0749 family)